MTLQRPMSKTSMNAYIIMYVLFCGQTMHRYIFNRDFGMLLAGWFCFVQTEDGKVVTVQHSPRETEKTVDFKRAIAAAFQANFKGTSEAMESDPQSTHMSHYT